MAPQPSSTAKGHGILYFSSKTQLGFNIAQSTNFPMQHDGKPHEHEIMPIASWQNDWV
jgi:hypothetical protein